MKSDQELLLRHICRGPDASRGHISLVIETAKVIEISDFLKFCQTSNLVARMQMVHLSKYGDPYGASGRITHQFSSKGFHLEGETRPVQCALGITV